MTDFYSEIKRIVTSTEVTKKYAKMTLFLVVITFAYNTFILPINLVAGGAGGLGVLFNALFSIDPAFVIFAISFFMFLLAFLFLDAEEVVATLFVAIVYPLLLKAFEGIDQIFLVDTSHTLVLVVFGAILTGVGQGSILRLGLNFGGLSVLSKVIYKYTRVSVTFINAFVNATIVVIGAFALGFLMILYAILFLVISRMISERVILGRSNNKTFKIISRAPVKIENFIHNELKHDVTIYDTYGVYKEKSKKLIMTVIPTSEFTILRDYVKSVDKNAFIFITDTYEAKRQDVMINENSVK